MSMGICNEDKTAPSPSIKIVKPVTRDAILRRKSDALRRIDNMASELGRMQKLLSELRADVLHITVE